MGRWILACKEQTEQKNKKINFKNTTMTETIFVY